MSRISLCVIAQTKKLFCQGMLASLDNVADEIIVVDTGSSDKTAAIATAAGGKLVERWKEDFAEARNVACLTPQWIGSWFDCDERLAPGSAEGIRNAVQNDALIWE